jgi:hypothetical protein
MTFKKVMQSNKVFVIGQSDDQTELFPPGFRYCVGEMTYTVVKDLTKEPTSAMREVMTSDGHTEIMSVEVIQRDLKEWNAKVMDPVLKYAKTEVIAPVTVEPVDKEEIKTEEPNVENKKENK